MTLLFFVLPASLMLLSALMTRAVRGYALRRLLDVPNARSSHRIPTPRGGGLAIVVVFTLAILVLYGQGRVSLNVCMALAGALPVAAIGFLDDHGHVPARWRLLVQITAAGWGLYWLGGFESSRFGGETYVLGGFGAVLAGWLIVWMLNLFNFMDGIDGIAGGEVLTVALSAALLAGLAPDTITPGFQAVSVALAAVTAGFLVWNWPPAKIFMGDVGSGFVGFLVGLCAVWTAGRGGLSLAVWLILTGVFFVDATVTLLRRMAGGQRWYEAHRSHAYQHAAQRWGHQWVTLTVAAINLGWLLPWAVGAVLWPNREMVFLGLAYGPLLGLAFWLDAGKSQEQRRG